MTHNSTPTSAHDGEQMEPAVHQINSVLLAYSDKDWNYSRITLVIRPLHDIDSPYVLRLELLDLATSAGKKNLKTLVDEVNWGDRHSSELGVLEVVSLRINKALLAATNDEFWQHKRAVIRIVRREELAGEHPTHAIWYQVTEVAGEDFDNR
jgi:hypothetical protein